MRCQHCGTPVRQSRGRCLTCGGRVRAGAAAARSVLIVGAGTPLRDRAGSPAAVLQTLGHDEAVEVLGRDGTFLHVRLGTGQTGYVESAGFEHQKMQNPEEVVTGDEPASDLHDLPFGLVRMAREQVLYTGHFLYDPFRDRACVVTTHRVIIGGGGASLPRVFETAEIASVHMREGSNGMALGERTIVIELTRMPGETYIAELRDPERAFARLQEALRYSNKEEPAR